MKIDDVLVTEGEKDQVARFFKQLWNELDAPMFRNEHNIIDDIKSRGRYGRPSMVPQTVMKSMSPKDEPFIIFKSKYVSFYESSLKEARRENCTLEDCCSIDTDDLDVLFNHADVQVNALAMMNGHLEVHGNSYHSQRLEDPQTGMLCPARILMLLSGQYVTDIDNDGEVHVIKLDV